MRSILYAICLLAAIAAAAAGQTIEGPDQVEAGKPAWFAISGAGETASAVFIPGPELDADGNRIKAGNALFWTEAPGRYQVSGIVVDWDKRLVMPISKTVEVTGKEDPDPDPRPDPDPDPDPVPVQDLFVLLLEETDDRASGLEGANLNQHLEEVAAYLRSLGADYQILDDDQAAAQEWVALLETDQRPALMVSAPARGNQLIGAEPFGASAADTIQRLKALGVK